MGGLRGGWGWVRMVTRGLWVADRGSLPAGCSGFFLASFDTPAANEAKKNGAASGRLGSSLFRLAVVEAGRAGCARGGMAVTGSMRIDSLPLDHRYR